jgi:hypothetical protein
MTNRAYRRVYLENARRLASTVPAGRGKVLPEQGVVEVASAMEVEERRDAGSLCKIALALGLGDRLQRGVETSHIGLVVLLVVQLHDLTGDVRLKGTIVVCASIGSAPAL